MIPRTFLYDEYIGRPKFTEQKKPFEYIVPPPTSGVGTKIVRVYGFVELNPTPESNSEITCTVPVKLLLLEKMVRIESKTYQGL